MISEHFLAQFRRAGLLFGLALAALLAGLTPNLAQAAFLDPDFNPGASGTVYAIVVQPDGKILVGGGFGNLGGAYRPGIGRLNADGSLDSPFNPGNASVVIRAIALQNDGKILVGGGFSSLAGQPRSSLGRLNADGSLDTAFLDPGVRFNANFGTIEAIAIQSDGKVVIGGWFTEVAGQPRQNIARLNANGSLDAAFNPGANGRVNDLAIQPDGKILVGGEMTLLAGEARNYLGRLNANGALDDSYTINPGQVTDRVYAMALQPDGKLIIGGSLGGHVRRMNSDGSMDFSFVGTAGAVVYAVALQADGRILIGGSFGTVNGRERRAIARLGPDGVPDGSFNPGADLTVLAVAAQADGRVLAGGLFSQMGGVNRNRLGRTNPTTPTPVPDPAFNPTINNQINTVDLQADGKIVLGGTFTEIDGQPRGRVARLHSDGRLDGGFTTGESNGTVYAVAAQTDGKVIVGGNFTLLDGAARAGIGRLNADGSLDTDFNPGTLQGSFGGTVRALAVQADGKILVGGTFTSLGGQPRFNIGRLHSDGSVDADFNPGASSIVLAFLEQPDGKILVGGAFITLAGETQPYFGRLNPDGSLDSSVSPALNNRVEAIALQPDGKILLGGWFSCPGSSGNLVLRLHANGAPDNDFFSCADNPTHWTNGQITSLAALPDGKILLGGFFTRIADKPYETIGRLNSDGRLDGSFNPGTNGFVYAILPLPDDNILVGGTFSEIGGRPQPYIARLTDPLASLTNKVYLPMVTR
jgi:uncharacterized delta-60 repeat protein